MFIVFSAFVVYATWAAFQNAHYTFGPYLSPFYSPELFGDSPHAWFGPQPDWWPGLLPFSPALLILPFPGLLPLHLLLLPRRLLQGVLGRSAGCAVGEPRKGYLGEHSFPLILQNVHRYFLYVALVFIVVLSYDVWLALWFAEPGDRAERVRHRRRHPRPRWSTSSCWPATRSAATAFRHLVGGRMDEVSKSPVCD